ncbi:MAG: carbon dioxide concentrating mechanism protein CcmL, partial [Planctomycetota bacterium]|nr:carbon dioxide concentrating mechanism protein CcmL [Planctomycetota bacterium]
MRIAEIIGRVTLSRCHPSLRGATWKVVVPLDRQGLAGEESGRGEPFVI